MIHSAATSRLLLRREETRNGASPAVMFVAVREKVADMCRDIRSSALSGPVLWSLLLMRHLIPASFIALAASSIAFAGVVDVVTFTNRAEWRDSATDPDMALFPANWDIRFRTDNMIDVPIVLGVASGGNGWSSWTATSSSGEMVSTGNGIYSTPAGSSIILDFTGPVGPDNGGLRGIGGGFQFFDSEGVFVPGKIWLKLSNGTSIFKNFNNDSAFAGFWLTDPTLTITGLTIEPAGAAAAANFVGIDTLYLGYAGAPVPAPGAIALLGAAGLIATRRRR